MLVRFDYPRTLDNVFEEFVVRDFPQSKRSSIPAIEIAEYENESVVIAELPGVKKEDLKLTVEDNALTLSGERKPNEIPQDARMLLNEMRVREFSRTIEFPHEVEVNSISAELQNGVLRIVLPKAESARVRTIEVK